MQKFKTVDQLVNQLKPEKPVYCIRKKSIHAASKTFQNKFPGKILYAVKTNPHPEVLKTIIESGIENFKQTIERVHYWGEGSVRSKLLQPIWSDEITILYNPDELQKKHEFCSEKESLEYNQANLILLNYLVNNGYEKYLNELEENKFGNSILFNYKNKKYLYL